MSDAEGTDILRKVWSASAQQIVDKLLKNEPVDPGEVEKLQKSLENIESRESYEYLRDMTRTKRPRKKAA